MMKGNRLVLILLSIFFLIMASQVQAIETEEEQQLGDPSPPIHLGKMSIMEGTTKIKLNNDNLIEVKSGTQQDIYHFVIDYEFKEGSNINQEKWEFIINMSGIIDSSPKIEHREFFEDNWINNDEGRGEIWVEITGYDIWIENQNFITVTCNRYADVLWTGDFDLIDRASENVLVRVKDFPAPELQWAANEGSSWQSDESGENALTKTFTVTNVGEYETEEASLNIEGSDNFEIIEGDTTISLEAGESYTITVGFTPKSNGWYYANLTSSNTDEWYFKSTDFAIKGHVGKGKSKALAYMSIYEKIMEQFPLIQKILRTLEI